MITPGNSLEPCERFAALEEFDDQELDCAVCRRLKIIHDRAGQRTLNVAHAGAERMGVIEPSVRAMNVTLSVRVPNTCIAHRGTKPAHLSRAVLERPLTSSDARVCR